VQDDVIPVSVEPASNLKRLGDERLAASLSPREPHLWISLYHTTSSGLAIEIRATIDEV
jgi:hypothetical protein